MEDRKIPDEWNYGPQIKMASYKGWDRGPDCKCGCGKLRKIFNNPELLDEQRVSEPRV